MALSLDLICLDNLDDSRISSFSMVSIAEGMFGLGCWQAQGQMLRVVVTDAGKLFDVGVGVIVCWSLVIVDVDVPVEVIVAATTIF